MSILSSLKIEEIITKNNPYSSSFVFYHLPLGMGVTVGNCLRRVLLDYTTGIAISGVEISDKNGPIKTKLTSLEGVDKSTFHLILELKKIIFEEKKTKEGIFILEMDVENKEKKDRIITAGDFQKIEEVEIKNPEFELATLSAPRDGKTPNKLKIKLYCQKNWGYHQENQQQEESQIIPLDTNYSPIKSGQVNFRLDSETTNLGSKEEKLTLIIETNGCIKPKKVLQEALEITYSSFNHISKLINEKKKMKSSDEVSTRKEKREKSEEIKEFDQEK